MQVFGALPNGAASTLVTPLFGYHLPVWLPGLCITLGAKRSTKPSGYSLCEEGRRGEPVTPQQPLPSSSWFVLLFFQNQHEVFTCFLLKWPPKVIVGDWHMETWERNILKVIHWSKGNWDSEEPREMKIQKISILLPDHIAYLRWVKVRALGVAVRAAMITPPYHPHALQYTSLFTVKLVHRVLLSWPTSFPKSSPDTPL